MDAILVDPPSDDDGILQQFLEMFENFEYRTSYSLQINFFSYEIFSEIFISKINCFILIIFKNYIISNITIVNF